MAELVGRVTSTSCLLFLIAVTFSVWKQVHASPDKPLSINDLMDESYDKLAPPKAVGGGPVKVDIYISILTLRGLDAQLLSFDTDIFFHQYWKDPRLKLPNSYNSSKIVMDNKWREHIWTPDTFFKNSRDGKVHNIIIPYTYMTLSNDSTVFFASRLGLKLNCMMDLARFPHDMQICDVTVMSLQYPIEVVELAWKEFMITKNTLLPQFTITRSWSENCTKVYPIGTYSCLTGKVELKRRLGYYLINKFIPSVLIVLMSFVTFWIPPTAYPARVTLSVTSILTIVTQQYQSAMPAVSYIMALNIWIIGCIGFVFCTLLEYTLVVVAMDKSSGSGTNSEGCFGLSKIWSFRRASVDLNKATELDESPSHKKVPRHILLDRSSRLIFPGAFILFMFVYWLYFSI